MTDGNGRRRVGGKDMEKRISQSVACPMIADQELPRSAQAVFDYVSTKKTNSES